MTKILRRSFHNLSRTDIDEDALKVLYRLNRKGFKAYLVGGAVRDILLGKKPNDYDVATDARPGQIKKLFSNSFLIGRRFKLAHIRFKGNKIIEVATFRREPEDGSDEDIHNTFGTEEEDAYRRDITINALFYNIADFSVIDYVGGLDDIKKGMIRVIGDPDIRFKEDPVRIIRVLRHSARQNFRIHHDTASKIFRNRELLKNCSGARMYEEICKDIKSGFLMPVFFQLDLFGILPCLLGDIGQFYSDNQIGTSELLNYLKTVDVLNISGEDIPIQDVFSIIFWPWAKHIYEKNSEGQDKSKMIHDKMMKAGLQIQIPKVILAHIVQVLAILSNMDKSVMTGRFKYSERKKASYPDASKLFGIISGEYMNNNDPFGEFFRNKAPRTRQWRRPR
jgi:poly(A) polymerase